MENKKSFPKAFFVLIIFTLLTGKTAWAQEPAPCEHDWGFPTWTCADDYSAATAHFTCALCGATEDVDGTLADWIELADGNKLYEVNHNGLHQQILGPNALNFGLNQTLPTNHPYYILTPDARRGAYRIWSEDVKTVNYYILDDDDGSIDYSVNGQSMYLVTGYVNYRSDFDGNLNYFDNNNFVFGIVFTAKDRGDAVTVNVKGVAPHTYTVSNAIVGGTVTATSRSTNNAWLTKYSKAYEDDILWLDPTPDEGFELHSMTVTDAKGRDVEILEHDGRRYIIMPEVAVTINAQFRPTTWTALQTMLTNASTDANDPTVLALAADITATDSDAYLNLPSGCHVILDLNGHTIDRNMTEATSDGWVIKVNSGASLTIRDTAGGGTITGGWSTFSGAGIVSSSATLNIEGGTITGCRTTNQGGSAIKASGTLRISGGTITGNIANTGNNYGAMAATIYLSGTSNLYLSDGSISGNYCGYTNAGTAGIASELGYGAATLHLSGNYTLSGNRMGTYDTDHDTWTDLTASDLHNSARITVTIDDIIGPSEPAALVLNNYGIDNWKATFTSGWATHMSDADPEDYFTLTNPNDQGIGLNANGEATIGTLYTITLADGLTASTSQAVQGKTITLSGANAPTTIDGITYTTDYIVSYNDGEAHADHYTADANGHATFLMPHADATVNIAAGAITVTYINENGEEEICTEFTIVDSDHPLIVTGNSYPRAHLGENNKEHWYAVSGTVSLSSDLRIHGNTRIILCDGATFNVYAPLRGDTDSDLTIYGQPQGTGTLNVATAYEDAIGMSSLDITVNGGNVNATTTDDDCMGIYNNYDHILTINRGIITVTGRYGLLIKNASNLVLNGGTLIARGNPHAIYSINDIIINGGNIDAKGEVCALFSNQDIIINGGIVDAEAQTCAIYCDKGDIAILGGKVSATDDNNVGIKAYGNHTITLGFTNLTDRITASNYVCATLKVANGQILYDGSAYYGGTLDNNQLTSIAGKTLQPFVPTGVVLQENTPGIINATFSGTSLDTVNIPAPITVKEVAYHRTFTAGKASTVMLPFDYTCNGSEGGSFYRFVGVEQEGNSWVATMQSTAAALTANTPYLFMPTGTNITFTIPNEGVTLYTTGSGGGQTVDAGSHWTFKGTYEYKEWIADGANSDEIGKAYGFAGVAQDGINVGDFVKVASGAKIRPMSAYLIWNNTANLAPARGGMNAASASADKLPQSITVRLLGADGTVTNVGEIDMETGEVSFDGWYTLQGVKLDTEPTEPGVYINNGKKVTITH